MKKAFIRIQQILLIIFIFTSCFNTNQSIREISNFNFNWRFSLGDIEKGYLPALIDSSWRLLNLPHDWSIEGNFSKDNPATVGGGALPGGVGWYRKTFKIPKNQKNKLTYIDFDGIYRNSEVWINGNFLGNRPNGYISFRYELTPYLYYGDSVNVIAVKVDNSKQPNSRWYSGSGIYRNVRLISLDKLHFAHWGTYITTPEVDSLTASVLVECKIKNEKDKAQKFVLKTHLYDPKSKLKRMVKSEHFIDQDSVLTVFQRIEIDNPILWSTDSPNLYSAVIQIENDGIIVDDLKQNVGIRYFNFDVEKGFSLNGKNIKINGVCNHHDLGCLGTAVNKRAIERQLEILKGMGCNGIRTAHNPPAPELLDLCDQMGFIVMDESFDMWAKKKSEYDYHLDFNEWYKKDLRDLVLRDRNHPSVFIWSIGNEIIEQYDKTDKSGTALTKELTKIVKKNDATRPVTVACNDTDPNNPLLSENVVDIIGFNYHHQEYADFHKKFPGQKFIASETVSALATRGSYDMPSDSIRRWPVRWDLPFYDGNKDQSCSSYDNCSAPWGSTHSESWNVVKKYDFISGMFIWTGFDYLGEPTPYGWPSRSSYFGIVDLAGFPKDAYYFYQSEWTDKPVLHIFPHWNWSEGESVDVWAYTNCEEVELFLNNESLGKKRKSYDQLHLQWTVNYNNGTLKAVGKTSSGQTLTKELKTALSPNRITLSADRLAINADAEDLSFITVKIQDENGTLVPFADNLIKFNLKGPGKIVGVDNGSQTSHEPFKANFRRAFNGLCLVVIQSDGNKGVITLEASSENLTTEKIILTAN